MVNNDNLYYIDSLLDSVGFDFDTDDNDELDYYLVFMLLFKDLYQGYSYKSIDYVLSHVDDDVDNIQKKSLVEVDKLKTQYNAMIESIFNSVGILSSNISKAKLSSDKLKWLIKEQKQTIKNICTELKGQIKSTIYYIKNRGDGEEAFNLNVFFNRAIQRIKKMVSSAVQSVKDTARKVAYVFLYGNPLVNIVTKHDSKVCSTCQSIENDNPYFLHDAPILPIHPYCRCHVETVDGKGITQLPLTDEAEKLKYHTIGGVRIG